ncbi:unnamed protein product [Caenorhabditis auriculariae]|uniref:ABC transporter domain-containing protein n=1 Tax=Caenorhabditis auriculariae TaxID=2777116 RepID=A0A8S1H527_9PELO|nr:unnamed protein product [Caenorhabditis auriculariae]
MTSPMNSTKIRIRSTRQTSERDNKSSRGSSGEKRSLLTHRSATQVLDKQGLDKLKEPLLKKENVAVTIEEEPSTAPTQQDLDDERDIALASQRFRRTSKEKKSEMSSSVSQSVVSKKLSWLNIEASVRKDDQDLKPILKSVTGCAKAGEVTFIMGSSGAGKTTLLNILTGRNLKKIERQGQVFVNNREMRPGDMNKVSAYVQQDDVFIGLLTVSETLHFAAKLRSPKELTEDERHEIVDDLISMMSLSKCKDTKVGSSLEKSLSRGERKRLAFACEVLTDPPILFCDEPTSGLDSYMAHQVVKSLVRLSKENKTIVCTIHQPSTIVYQMADTCGYKLPDFISLPDHFMRIVSQGNSETEIQFTDRVQRVYHEYEEMSKPETPSCYSSKGAEDGSKLWFHRSWVSQFVYLFDRAWKQLMRDRQLIIIKIFQTTLMSIMLGCVFLQMPLDKAHLDSYKGISFVSVQLMHMLFLFPSMTIFWRDFPIVVREYQSNMYSPSAYFAAKSLVDTIQYLCFPAIFATIVYFMAGLPLNFFSITTYVVVVILMSATASSVAHAAASCFGDLPTAMSLVPLFTIPLMTCGGFYISRDRIPIYFYPFKYLSWHGYAFEIILIGLLADRGHIEGCTGQADLPDVPCSTGEQAVIDASFHPDHYWRNFGFIFFAIFFWKLVATVAYTYRVRKA